MPSFTEPFLILHKVRGEPALDVAHQIDMGEGEVWWIVTTSGHRAYPLTYYHLFSVDASVVEELSATTIPDDWPDHYTAKGPYTSKSERTMNQTGLIARLGLGKPKSVALRRPVR